MWTLSFTVMLNKCVILLVILLFPLPMNSSSLSGASMESGQSGQTDSSQQIFRRIDDRFGSDKVINTVLNINDSNTAEVLNNFNISKDEILRRISTLPQPMVNNGNGRSSVSERSHIDNDANFKPSSESSGTEIEKQEALEHVIRQFIESKVQRNSSRHTADYTEPVIHDMAFYPLCSKNNQTSWLEENTAKLYFSSSIFEKLVPNTFLQRAILRLRQKIPENVPPSDSSVTSEFDPQNGCSDLEDIIHVKISIFIKRSNRGDTKPVLKKLVCNSLTLNRVNNDWVEIDVRQVIKHWEKMYRASLIHNKGGPVADPMVAIDVEDEYQQPLKAGLFFESSDCQASPPIPWFLYGKNVRSLSGTQILPNNPRLDIQWYETRRNHHQRPRKLNYRQSPPPPPPMPADYQYEAAMDQSNLNVVSMSPNCRTHRKRHAQQRNHRIGHANYVGRIRRSLQYNKQNQSHKSNVKRKFVARIA